MENNSIFSNEPQVISEESNRAYELLGVKFGHAVAVKVENGYQVGYIGQIISPKVFKDVKSLRSYMRANPYEFLPLMAHLYNERINELKTQQK